MINYNVLIGDVISINYLGLKCGVCGEDFKDDDDVVVCPDCGTPSHRSCYKENKGCPNADKHGAEFVFEGFDKIKKSAQEGKDIRKKPTDDTSDGESDEFVLPESSNIGGSKFLQVSVRKEIPCPYCGELNKAEANYCNKCGAKFAKIQPVPVLDTDGQSVSPNQLGQSNSFSVPTPPQAMPYTPDPLAGVPANSVFDDNVTAAELASFVSVNTPYYLRTFDLLKNKNRKKFNFSACLFSGLWFLYRKMYKIGSLIFSVELLLYAVRFYITQRYGLDIMQRLSESVGKNPDQGYTFEQIMQMSDKLMTYSMQDQLMFMIPSLLFFAQLFIMIFCGIIANKTYYKHCIGKISDIKKAAKEESLDNKETAQALYFSGGVNPFVAAAFSLLYLILFR